MLWTVNIINTKKKNIDSKNFRNQLIKANELGMLISLIIEPKEMEQKEVIIKNMKTDKQKTFKIDTLIEEIYEIIDNFAG